MPTRLIIAYSMIALMVSAGVIAMWVYVWRDLWAARGRRIRFHRDRARVRAEQDSDLRAREAYPAE